MNRFVFAALFLILLAPNVTYSQVQDGFPLDSTTIRFSDTLSALYLPDTSAIPLWQIGHSHKSFFGADSAGFTMMTDTVNSYPKNANNWFYIKFVHYFNSIVDFWHKYQTDAGKDGGVVEFSLDTGTTWQNVKGDCNVDSLFDASGVLTTNFYSKSDTIAGTGYPSFTGVKDSLQYSRIQFYDGELERTTGGSSCSFPAKVIYVRFRFISDTTADTLAGWEIDSIKIERDLYSGGGVRPINRQRLLNIYPNPSYDGTFSFPALNNEENYTIEVYNAIGERVFKVPYARSLDLGNYPKGLYFYKVSDGTEYYSGRLLLE